MRATRSEKISRFPFFVRLVRLKSRSLVMPTLSSFVADNSPATGASPHPVAIYLVSKFFYFSPFLFNRIYFRSDATIPVRNYSRPDRFSIIRARSNMTPNDERYDPKNAFKNPSGLTLKEWPDVSG